MPTPSCWQTSLSKRSPTDLSADKPEITIQASQGNCSVEIKTAQWHLWSQAQNGKIVNHGAKIN